MQQFHIINLREIKKRFIFLIFLFAKLLYNGYYDEIKCSFDER